MATPTAPHPDQTPGTAYSSPREPQHRTRRPRADQSPTAAAGSGYRFALDRHVLPRWGSIRLVDVTHGEIQGWANTLSTSLGPSIDRQIYLVLAGVLKFAVRDGRPLKNPADDVQLPRLIKRSRGYLTHAQLRILADECAPWSDLLLFLGYTGLRWGRWRQSPRRRSTNPEVASTCAGLFPNRAEWSSGERLSRTSDILSPSLLSCDSSLKNA